MAPESESIPDELLLLVFLHGFKGGADTFAAFPERIVHSLSQCQPRYDVQAIVYPPYDTRGELVVAVDNHVTWLTALVAERKAAFTAKGGNGPTRVVLLGHSMGGLVIADTVLLTLETESLPILGVIAFDSPYLGLSPSVFKNTFDKALNIASQGQAALAALGVGYGLFKSATTTTPSTTPPRASSPSPPRKSTATSDKVVSPPTNQPATAKKSSSWFSLTTVAGVAAAAGAFGAAGAAYYNRDAITERWTWATSHLSFVGELWKTEEMETRIGKLVGAKDKGVGFHCFYTLLPPTSSSTSRTFCVLPHTPSVRACFSPNVNSRAADEIAAHIEMFTEESDGMYELGSGTCKVLRGWLDEARAGRMGGSACVVAEKGKGKEKVEEPVRLV